MLTNRAKPRLVSTRNKTSSTFKKNFNPVIGGTYGSGMKIEVEDQIEDDGDDFSKRFGDLFSAGRNTGFSSHSGSKTSRKHTMSRYRK